MSHFSIRQYLSDEAYRFRHNASKGIYNHWSDEKYLCKIFRLTFGYDLPLNNPQTFNEKLQWLKIYDRNPEYTAMVDKYEAKRYVGQRIGKQYIIPTLGVWDRFGDIDFTKLPPQFVLKCTHDSGGLVIAPNIKDFDKKSAKKKIERSMKRNFFYYGREWPYKNVKPRIIAEQLLTNPDQLHGINDYKLMCFNGKVLCSFVCSERYSTEGLNVTFYDRNWNKLPFERHYPSSKRSIEKPKRYEEMVALAEVLSERIPFLRVDFYEVNDQIYFGELTFYPGSGFEEFNPIEWDLRLGQWIQLPERK